MRSVKTKRSKTQKSKLMTGWCVFCKKETVDCPTDTRRAECPECGFPAVYGQEWSTYAASVGLAGQGRSNKILDEFRNYHPDTSW